MLTLSPIAKIKQFIIKMTKWKFIIHPHRVVITMPHMSLVHTKLAKVFPIKRALNYNCSVDSMEMKTMAAFNVNTACDLICLVFRKFISRFNIYKMSRHHCCSTIFALAIIAISALPSGSAEGGGNEANPCNEEPEQLIQCNGLKKARYFFDKVSQSCVAIQSPDCEDQVGFSSIDTCREDCMKARSARRLPGDNKFSILSDFEISAPKQLSITARRKFPLQFCQLQWDSGLICPGIRRGSYIDQFFYDGKTNSCQHFVYNGCGGNANRFYTIWQCVESCVRKVHGGRRYF